MIRDGKRIELEATIGLLDEPVVLASTGSRGGGSSAFGAKTGDVFTWITVVVAAVLLVVCVVANFMLEPPTDAQVLAADTTGVPLSETTPPPGSAPSEGAPVVLPTETAPPDESQIEQSTDDGSALPIDSPETTGADEAAKPQPEGVDGTGGSDGDSEDPSTP